MSEVANAEQNTQEAEIKVPTKIVSAGRPEPMKIAPQQTLGDNDVVNEPPPAVEANIATENAEKDLNVSRETKDEIIAPELNEDGSPKAIAPIDTTPKPLTDEEIKAEYEKRFPVQSAKTEEQLKADELALDKRMLNEYMNGGGTIENYARLKQAVEMTDLTEMSKIQLTAELKQAGFTDDEIKIVQKERYYQLEQEEIDSIEDDEEKALKLKAKDYASKKLLGKAERTKQAAQSIFDNLKQAITEQDKEVQEEKALASNLDAYFTALPRKTTIQLEKTPDGVDNPPIEVDVPEEVVNEVREMLKDSDKRNSFLYKQDGSLNYEVIAETLIRSRISEKAATESYSKGVSKGKDEQVAIFEKTFPVRNANAIGVNGNGNARPPVGKGQLVSAGQPQKFRPQPVQR